MMSKPIKPCFCNFHSIISSMHRWVSRSMLHREQILCFNVLPFNFSMEKEPSKRPSPEIVLQHPFIRMYDDNDKQMIGCWVYTQLQARDTESHPSWWSFSSANRISCHGINQLSSTCLFSLFFFRLGTAICQISKYWTICLGYFSVFPLFLFFSQLMSSLWTLLSFALDYLHVPE